MEQIKSFIASNSRNHVAFIYGYKFDAVSFVDVGLGLSTKIEDILQHRKLSMKAQDYVNDIFREYTRHSDDFGDFLAIKNIGILFEPLLKLDVFALINRWSQNQLLLIQQNDSLVENNIFHLTHNRSQEYSVNLQGINHIVIVDKI